MTDSVSFGPAFMVGRTLGVSVNLLAEILLSWGLRGIVFVAGPSLLGGGRSCGVICVNR